jgi:hypothetical protein
MLTGTNFGAFVCADNSNIVFLISKTNIRHLVSSLPTSSISLASASVKESKRENVGYISEEQNIKPRFTEYYEDLLCLQTDSKVGDSEPLIARAIRPFLLVEEANSSGNKFRSAKKRKGNGKNKDNSIAKTFTLSNPIPAGNKYLPDNQIYTTNAEYETLSAFSSSTTVPVFYGTYFTVGSLDQFSSLSAVFDQYRVDEVEWWCVPNNHVTSQNGGGFLTSVVDYDDANALSTVPQALDYQNALTNEASAGHYRRFKPHAAVAMYSGTFASYGNIESPWIDCASPSVQHYGIKIAVTAMSSISGYNTITRLLVSFRNVR